MNGQTSKLSAFCFDYQTLGPIPTSTVSGGFYGVGPTNPAIRLVNEDDITFEIASDVPVKITDVCPEFKFGEFLDGVYDEFGGIREILKIKWNSTFDIGHVSCLMKDWRVIFYKLVANDFVSLTPEQRRIKVHSECRVFEDMDDWAHWFEVTDFEDLGDRPNLNLANSTKVVKSSNVDTDAFFNGDYSSLYTELGKDMVKND